MIELLNELQKQPIVLFVRVVRIDTMVHVLEQVRFAWQQIEARFDQLSNCPLVTMSQSFVIDDPRQFRRFLVVVFVLKNAVQELTNKVQTANQAQHAQRSVRIHRVYVIVFFVFDGALYGRIDFAVVRHALFDIVELVYEIHGHKCEYFAQQVKEPIKKIQL